MSNYDAGKDIAFLQQRVLEIEAVLKPIAEAFESERSKSKPKKKVESTPRMPKVPADYDDDDFD